MLVYVDCLLLPISLSISPK